MSLGLRTALLVAAAVLSASGQTPGGTAGPDLQMAPPPLRITVTLVQVDAVVTDSKGKHIAGLRPEDFTILQDGQPRPLTFFAWVPEGPLVSAPPAPKGAAKMPIGPPAPISATQVRRTVAIVVDDLSFSFESISRVRDALRKYVEAQMQPGDLVAIVRTGGGVSFLEQFTTDRRLLLEAVDTLRWRFTGRCCAAPIAPDPDAPAAARRGEPEFLDYSVSLRALGAMATLDQVIRGLKNMPGRKSVVFLSDSLRLESEVARSVDRLTDIANRSAVSIYTIDPKGLKGPDLFLSESLDSDGGSPLDAIGRAQDPYGTRDQEGLEYLARRTGGLAYVNNNDIPGSISFATQDQLGYYLLGYSPPEGTFEGEQAGSKKFHRVQVRVNQSGLRVRWKTGFEGVADNLELTPPSKTREQQLLEALASPFTATGLNVRVSSFYTEAAKRPSARTLLYFGGRELTFTRDPAGMWSADVDIVVTAYRGVKQAVSQRQRVEHIRLPDDVYQRALREGFVYVLDDPITEPGAYLVRAVVRDQLSEKIGSSSQFLHIPDTRKGRLGMTSIVLKLAPERMQKVKAESLADKGNAVAWTEGGPATRRYLPGQSLLYSFIVVNPKEKRKKLELKQQVNVFRNGRQFYTGSLLPVLEGNRLDEQRVIGAGLLHLGSRLIPGEYLLQVTVTDRHAKKKQAQVAQWVDFEVKPAPEVQSAASAP